MKQQRILVADDDLTSRSVIGAILLKKVSPFVVFLQCQEALGTQGLRDYKQSTHRHSDCEPLKAAKQSRTRMDQ